MLLILNESNEIIAYNKVVSKNEVKEDDLHVWFDGDFTFGEGEEMTGKRKRYFWNGGIEIRYEDIPEPTPEPLSPTEQAILQTAINTEYMAAMMEIKG